MADRKRTVRLPPEVIVDAAMRVTARAEPDGLTGKALGNERGVDRSAVWRHAADRHALLLAVGDRLLQKHPRPASRLHLIKGFGAPQQC